MYQEAYESNNFTLYDVKYKIKYINSEAPHLLSI